MTEPSDKLVIRLSNLSKEDLYSVAQGGLRVPGKRLRGMSREALVELCSAELRAAAGSSTRNVFRGPHALPYKQILIDVADKLTPGLTPLSWTRYRLSDASCEEDIEAEILRLFEQRTRKWWSKLPEKKRREFVQGINSVLRADDSVSSPLAKGPGVFLQQQAVEQLVQTGVVAGVGQLSATGALGAIGVSMIGQIGWLVLLQTVGWWAGVKIAVLGIGGYGAWGGAVAWLGTAAIGTAVAVPGLVYLADGPAYRKTIPTTIMILAKGRIDQWVSEEQAEAQPRITD